MTEWQRNRISPHRPPTEDELDAMYQAIGTTRETARIRAQQRQNRLPRWRRK